MAQRTIVTYYDDLDGKPIDDGLAQTFEFTVDGVTYELDLRPANADAFRKDLTHWITIAQRQKRDATRRPPSPAPGSATRPSPARKSSLPPSAPGPRPTAIKSPTAAAFPSM